MTSATLSPTFKSIINKQFEDNIKEYLNYSNEPTIISWLTTILAKGVCIEKTIREQERSVKTLLETIYDTIPQKYIGNLKNMPRELDLEYKSLFHALKREEKKLSILKSLLPFWLSYNKTFEEVLDAITQGASNAKDVVKIVSKKYGGCIDRELVFDIAMEELSA